MRVYWIAFTEPPDLPELLALNNPNCRAGPDSTKLIHFHINVTLACAKVLPERCGCFESLGVEVGVGESKCEE